MKCCKWTISTLQTYSLTSSKTNREINCPLPASHSAWGRRSEAEFCSTLALWGSTNLFAHGKPTQGTGFASNSLVGLLGLCFLVKCVPRWSFDSKKCLCPLEAFLMAKMWKCEPELPSSFRELSMKKVLCQTSPSWRKPILFFLSANNLGLGPRCLHYN